MKIGDACFVGDGAHASIRRAESGVPYLMARNLKDGKLDLSSISFIEKKDYDKHFKSNSRSLTRPQYGDVIFGIIGSIGGVYVAQPEDKFGLSSSIAILRPKSAGLDAKFLNYWVTGPIFQNALFSIKGGVAQSYVSLEMIRSLPLTLPPVAVPRRIASILSAYDDLIENNKRRIAILEEMARRTFDEWFVRSKGLMGGSRIPGTLPSGWTVARLPGIAAIQYGKTLPAKMLISGGPYPVYGAAKIIGHYTDFNCSERTIIVGCRGSVGAFSITEPYCFVTNNAFLLRDEQCLHTPPE